MASSKKQKNYIANLYTNTVLTFLSLLLGSVLFAQQTYNTPCDAEAMPIDGWMPTNQTQTVRGNLTTATPFVTDNAGGIQDFGCSGIENAIFYKVEFDPSASSFSIAYNGGSATNISIAVFSLSSTECGGGTAFGESIYTDVSGNDLLSCDLIGESPVRFDLCDFTAADFNNLYIWISTPAANEGTVNIDINQYVPPPNDDCINAIDISQMSGRGEQCHSYFNFGACSDMINYTTRPPDMNDVPCLINDPSDPGTAGVWLQFTTDANAELLDLYFNHENNQQLTVGLYAGDPDCTNLLPLDCWSDDTNGVIDGIENYEINPDTTYYLYIYTDKFISGTGEMCIDIKPPIPCETAAPEYYTSTVPFCNMSELNQLCVEMEAKPDYRVHPWPECGNRRDIENPNWFSFVAGSDQTILEFIISNCNPRDGGVEIGVFQLPCEEPIGGPMVPPQTPERLRLISDCAFTECNDGSTPVEIDISTEPGGMYGVLLDGCDGSLCDVEINVIQAVDPPDISGDPGIEIQFDDPGFGFDGDTVCIGAQDVEFYIEQQVPGACYYEWVLENGISRKNITELSTTFDFPIEGSYLIEVFANNYCYESEPATLEIIAADLPPFEMRDTICEGDPYTWIGPYGNEIIPRPEINTNTGGDFVYSGDTENSLSCSQSGTLSLHIRNENDEYPTRLDSIICVDQLPISIRNTEFTGNVEDVIVSDPIASNGCDSFFSVNLTVLGGNFFIRPACDELGNVIFRFEEVGGPQLSWYEQFALYEDTTNDYSLESEFIAVEKDSVLSNSLPMTLSQSEIEALAENGALNVQLRLIIKYDGKVICNSISPPVEFRLDDNFPGIDQILGDTTYCPGQELKLYADVHHPAAPAPFGEFPDSIGVYNWYPPDGFTTDSPSVVLHDTLYMQAPSSPTDNTVCLKVTSERCLFTDSVCRELMIDEPIQPILEPDNETCDTFWTFAPDTVEEGVWSTLRPPGINNSATFSDTSDPNATVTINERGVYTFLWREGAQSCAKYDSITIDFLESTIIPEVSDTCYDLEFVAEVILANGRGGYTIHPSSTITGMINDSTFVSDSITIDQGPGGNFGDVLYLVVEDSLGCISDPIPIRLVCNCETKIGEMSPQEIELCEGETAVSNYLGGHTNDGTDTIMYILHAGPLSELEGIVDSSLNGSFMYPADIVLGQTYYISAVIGNAIGAYVDLDDPCLQVAQGQAVTWYEIPATLVGEPDTTCGSDYNLQGISSVGQFNWNMLAGPGMLTFSDPSDPNANISVNNPGTYQLRAIEDNEGCADSSEVSIHFLGEIEYQLFYECDSAATSYVATIILSGGGNEYTLVEGAGTLIEDTLRTNPIPKGESRQFIVDSDFECGPDTIEVESDCECLTQIGTFNNDTSVVTCEANCINVSTLYNPAGESHDGNDIGVYILHNGDDTLIIDPIHQEESGQFCYTDFQSEVELGDTVYVSYIIGNNAGNGTVDLDDPCLKVTQGAALIFEPVPNANAGPDEANCGLSTTLNATATLGTGQWRFVDGPSANVDIISISNPHSLIEVDTVGTYQLEWSVSEFGCVDKDTVHITFLDGPRVDDVVVECDSTGSTYTVSFTIMGGQTSTYSVTGEAGSLIDSFFISDPIASDSSYRFVITDGNNCDSVVLSDTHNCSCITSVGELSGSALLLCEDEAVNGISYDDSGEMRDANDELLYTLLDENGNVIATSQNPDFTFDDGILDLNTTYYIRVYLGSVIGGQFKFDESCTDYDGMIPVSWYAYPKASAVAVNDSITCSHTTVNIDGTFSTGQNLIYSWSTMNGSIQGGTENDAIVTVTSAGLYTLTVKDSVSGCSNDTSLQIFKSDDIPLSVIETPDTLNCRITELELDGSASSQGTEFKYEWSTQNGNIISTDSTQISALVDRAGTYTLTVRNTTNGCQADFSVIVREDKEQPVATAEVEGQINCGSPQVKINGEGSSFGPLIEYQWTTQNGRIISDPSALNINVSRAGVYQLIVLNTKNACQDSTTVTVEQDTNDLHNLQYSLTDPSCYNEDDGAIQIEVEDGLEPIIFKLNSSFENGSGVFTELAAGEYTIEVEDANGCLLRDTVQLINPPELMVMLTEEIEVMEGDSTTIEATITGSLQYDTIIWETNSVPFECLNPECTLIRITPPSDMIVNVSVQAGLACSDRDSTYIVVKEVTEEQSVYIPNVFTPDDDGINDYFLPETGQNVNRITLMQIYDRWGNLVFESRNFRTGIFTEGWDGKFKGEDLSSGVFTYLVEVLYLNGDQETVTGTVTLMR